MKRFICACLELPVRTLTCNTNSKNTCKTQSFTPNHLIIRQANEYTDEMCIEVESEKRKKSDDRANRDRPTRCALVVEKINIHEN